MKLINLSIILISITIWSNTKGQIRFDGLYETKCDYEHDDEGEQSYLRFYPNGKVISVGTDCDGKASDLRRWFTIDSKKGSQGDYHLEGANIKFTTTSNVGSVEYEGTILESGILRLKSKSLMNGYEGIEEYHFVKVKRLK